MAPAPATEGAGNQIPTGFDRAISLSTQELPSGACKLKGF